MGRKYLCANYSECLDQAARAGAHETPCRTCGRYRREDIEDCQLYRIACLMLAIFYPDTWRRLMESEKTGRAGRQG